jgi:putative tricarboxylic transport membrane protein
MKQTERFSGAFWVVLGIVIAILSLKLGMGNLHKPGIGFAPFLAAGILTVSGLVQILATYSRQFAGEKTGSILFKKGRKDSLLALAALFGYIIFLEFLGFLLTTLIFLVFLFRIKEKERWVMPLVLSVATVVVSYLIFSVWLQLQFPKGPLGI